MQVFAQPAAVAILPDQFGGWHRAGSLKVSKDPSVADSVNSPVLSEYGFGSFESATYDREEGRKLQVRAARFADASGAYGAFTFYKTPEMLSEKIGDQGASLNQRVLFYRGNILVDALFDKLTAMSAAELRDLADALPQPDAGARSLPSLPTYLPHQSYIRNSAKYVMGPVALQKAGAPIPAALVDFSRGAEVVLGRYTGSGGEATLMLISYPTPQIAADRLKQIDASHQPNAQQPGAATLVDIEPFFDRRSGPIIAIAAGPLSQSEARSLLDGVNYDADVTWNENTYITRKDNLANLLVNVILLCGILIGLALVAGVAFGGVRILIKRVFPDRVFDRPEGMEFISLHLADKANEADSRVSPSIKVL